MNKCAIGFYMWEEVYVEPPHDPPPRVLEFREPMLVIKVTEDEMDVDQCPGAENM
jgi:hypothetical protein